MSLKPSWLFSNVCFFVPYNNPFCLFLSRQVILIEFLPKYPIFRPDWGGCDGLDVWPLTLILSALYIQYVGTRVCTAVSHDNPVHLPVPCTFATLSLCFRADFAHFPNRTRCVAFIALGRVFVTCDKQVKLLKKCIYPKETINLCPICYISNPLRRMWCLHLP